MDLSVCKTPHAKLSYTNCCYLSPDTLATLLSIAQSTSPELAHAPPLLSMRNCVFFAMPSSEVPAGQVALNSLQRDTGSFQLNQAVMVSQWKERPECVLAGVEITVDVLQKGRLQEPLMLETGELSAAFHASFDGHVFLVGQRLAMDFEGKKLLLEVSSHEHADMGEAVGGGGATRERWGQVHATTSMTWNKPSGAMVSLRGQESNARNELFRQDFDFGKLGIGGLDEEFNQIFRRAFASRIYPTHIVNQLGIHHVRGMLLYGPPGCGKTLIARQIGKVLNAREPKIVNGPEILDKYVGGSEERIRELFADAEADQSSNGDDADLHIVIFDEIDAICKTRGSVRDNTGVSDSIVNQLLSKIDGVESLNNILIIGMTNRKDLIDEALLRPGRLEVHVEIGLPDERGRLQIIGIHTASMREHNRLSQEGISNMGELARLTKNFSGAEIEGLVKSAASFAFHRNVDVKDTAKPLNEADLIVEWDDFLHALDEVQPAFGVNNDVLSAFYRNGIINFGERFEAVQDRLRALVNQVRTSERTPLLSVLLRGGHGTGKTALAAHLAVESGFPFVRIISPETMIGYSEGSKCQHILKVFSDSYRSPLSVIVIDDIERLVDYAVGPRFSSMVLQTLLILLRKVPPDEGHRVLVIGTTSEHANLDVLGIPAAFNVHLEMPALSEASEIVSVLANLTNAHLTEDMARPIASASTTGMSHGIGIKQLILMSEMARNADPEGSESGTAEAAAGGDTKSGDDDFDLSNFLECLHTYVIDAI